MNKVKFTVCVLLIVFTICFLNCFVYAETVTTGIETFPISYQGYLKAMIQKHPNWVFKALWIGVDYNYAVEQESVLSSRYNNKSISLAPRSWNTAWHHVFDTGGNITVNGNSLYQHEAGWVTASVDAVKFTMDPRNFLNEENIFLFEDLQYNVKVHTLEGIESILYGTEMCTYNSETKTYTIKDIEYYDTDGKLQTYLYDKNGDGKAEEKMTYAEAYMLAAKESGVNPYSLAIRTKNETGCMITSNGQICGTATNYPGYYNYYSIGAYGTNPMENGVKYAKNANWWNPVIAIVEGAKKIIGGEYVTKGQNTPYLTKYNVSPDAYYSKYTHQYMTDVTCTYRESFQMFDTYNSTGEIDRAIEFLIPVYDNMPDLALDIYQSYANAFKPQEENIVLNQKTKLYSQIQISSGMARIELLELPAGTKLKLIATSLSGMYDKVIYTSDDGCTIAGYIFYNTAVGSITKMVVADGIYLNMRTKPSINGTYIKQLTPGTIVTRIEKNSSIDSTGIWDKIILEDDTIGYACREYTDGTKYLNELVYNKVASVSFSKNTCDIKSGQSAKTSITILPANAQFKEVSYISSDTSIATVDSNGVVKAIKEGTVSITVTTEDQQKTAVCTINVIPTISMDKERYTVKIYEEFTPNVVISGVDTSTYELISGDEKIVQVINNRIKAVALGETEIIAKVLGRENISTVAKIVVTLTDELPEEKFNFNDTIQIVNNNHIVGVTEGFTVGKLKEQITTNMKYEMYNLSQVKLEDSSLIGTGCKIKVTDRENKVKEYTIVIYGDVTGDGKINLKDALTIEKYYVGLTTLDGPFLTAGSIRKRTNEVSLVDSLAIKKHYVGIESILQKQ